MFIFQVERGVPLHQGQQWWGWGQISEEASECPASSMEYLVTSPQMVNQILIFIVKL